ncbi:MAG: helix-turn-helix domain-containing protein [Flavobacteriales bacterium]
MKLEYKGKIEESLFVLTDFNCAPAQQMLQDKGMYKILWASKKNCTVQIDGCEINLEQHQVLFCTTLNIVEIPTNSGILAIVFNREFYCIRDHDYEISCNGMLFFGSSEPPIISLSQKDVTSFQTIFSVLKEEFETSDHIQGEMLVIMLKRLLIKSTRLVQKMQGVQNFPNSQMELVRKYHVLVEQNFRVKHKVSEYAELLCKSPKTISNIFNKMERNTPLEVINQRIMLEAKRLLLFSDKTAEQISYELGYKEGAHFSKFFKLHSSFPPAEFRTRHKKNRLSLSTQTVS